MNLEKTFSLLTDLDTIMDTRAGLLFLLDVNLLEEVILNGTYDSRLTDQFGYLPNTVFKKFYDKRNKEVLLASTPSKAMDLIQETFINSFGNAELLESDSPTLYINTFPYNLTDAEIMHLSKGIMSMLSEVHDVEFINMEHPTIDWLVQNVKTIIMYDGLMLLDNLATKQGLAIGRVSGISLVVPSIIHDDPLLTDDEYEKFFRDIETSVNPMINLQYASPSYFTMMR